MPDGHGSIGAKFTQKMSRALWYLDTRHAKFFVPQHSFATSVRLFAGLQ